MKVATVITLNSEERSHLKELLREVQTGYGTSDYDR